MPKFHFDVSNGHADLDPEGVELPDVATAKSEAVKLLAAMMKDNVAFWEDKAWSLRVTDDRRMVLFELMILGFEAPAIQGS